MREYPFITLNMTEYGGIYLTTYSEHYKTFNLLDTEGKGLAGKGGGGPLDPSWYIFVVFFHIC